MLPRNSILLALGIFSLLAALSVGANPSSASNNGNDGKTGNHEAESENGMNIQLGPRPYFLVNNMEAGKLKSRLKRCGNGPFRKTDFSISHRGAALQFPEHTEESYEAAVRMGAGVVECDVTFTKDKELVCRHSQCDLHATTNILDSPLAGKCTRPFTPAQFDAAGDLVQEASAHCCTSVITMEEFKSLRGKMDGFNPAATSIAEYLGGTPNWRTDLYSGPSSGTLLTHKESIPQEAGRKNDA